MRVSIYRFSGTKLAFNASFVIILFFVEMSDCFSD